MRMNKQRADYLKEVYALGRAAYKQKYAEPKPKPQPRFVQYSEPYGPYRSPRLISRRCGGWLAVSATNDLIKIGVTGDTEEDTRLLFVEAMKQWVKLVEDAKAHPLVRDEENQDE